LGLVEVEMLAFDFLPLSDRREFVLGDVHQLDFAKVPSIGQRLKRGSPGGSPYRRSRAREMSHGRAKLLLSRVRWKDASRFSC
jgi:hypothetical protein